MAKNPQACLWDESPFSYFLFTLDRMYKLTDGTLVQRDWYSSFLLYCYNYRTNDIDKKKCAAEFKKCYSMENGFIEWIKTNKIKVLNSGIKIA